MARTALSLGSESSAAIHYRERKNLGNLKVGDQVKIEVTRSVAAYLDTDVDKGLLAPSSTPAKSARQKTTPIRAVRRSVRSRCS